jgi:ribonuclease Z
MRVRWIGVGEAFDPLLGNSSVLIEGTEHSPSDSKRILIDCGYAVPQNLLRFVPDFANIDLLYLTHSHGDHAYGIPGLLGALVREKRRAPLTIIGQPGTAEVVRQVVELAYSNLQRNLSFALEFVETTEPLQLSDFNLEFAPTEHARSNYSIKVSRAGHSVFVSGDGYFTAESKRLMLSSGLISHEAYLFDRHDARHTSFEELAGFLSEAEYGGQVALVHIEANTRQQDLVRLPELQRKTRAKLFVPEPGDVIDLSAIDQLSAANFRQ